MLKHAIENWKTTSAGIVMIVGAVVHLVFQVSAHNSNENSWTISVTSILGGIGLILAGDSGKSVQTKDVKIDAGGVMKQSDSAAEEAAQKETKTPASPDKPKV